tara:strand:- start:530 stop:805 length:276 start_codon:yes stop_codon:yes gene_type:complete
MEDNIIITSEKLTEFKADIVYWDKYIKNIKDFIKNEEPIKTDIFKLQNEITRVEFYKYKQKIIVEYEFLIKHKFSLSYKNQINQIYNDTNN